MSHKDIGLAQYISDLEKQKAELRTQLSEAEIAQAHAIRTAERLGIEWKTMLKIEGSPNTADISTIVKKPEDSPNPNSKPYMGMGNEDAVVAYLEKMNGRLMKTAQICDALKRGGIESQAKDFPAAIFGSLNRLVVKGKVERVGRGRRVRFRAANRAETEQGLLAYVQ